MPMRSLLLLSCAVLSVFGLLSSGFLPGSGAFASPPCEVAHPLAPPDAGYSDRCPNCGMSRAMWARTWIAFENPEGRYAVCSFHCMADISRKSATVPEKVQTALYHRPNASVPAAEAFFVIGSRARGTMTKASKIAFSERNSAAEFAAACGGRVTTWSEAYSTALAGLGAENSAIAAMRLKKGKIVEPRDRVDECLICGMYPARYHRNRAQVRTFSGKTVHFCSTQCLFKFLKDPRQHGGGSGAPRMIWVAGFASGRWISAKTAYFVVHSRRWGPMGYEAFAFDTRAEAESFADENGGSVLPFSEVRIEKILSAR